MTPALYKKLSSRIIRSRPALVLLVIGCGLGIPLWSVYGERSSVGAALIGLLWLVICAVVWFAPAQGLAKRLGSGESAGWAAALGLDLLTLLLVWLLVRGAVGL